MYLLAFAESIQLFPDGTLFIHIGLILIMIWILNRTFFRPINDIIASRDKNKGVEGGEAAKILRSVEEKEVLFRNEMLDARSQGYELIEKEQKKAVAARDKKIKDAKAELALKVAEGKAEIQKQSSDAKEIIGVEAAKMADKIAAGILRA